MKDLNIQFSVKEWVYVNKARLLNLPGAVEETKMLVSNSRISPGASILLYRFTNPAYRWRASCKPQSPFYKLFFSQNLILRALDLNFFALPSLLEL